MQGVWIPLQVFFKEVCPRDRERLLSEHLLVALNTSSFAEGSRIYVKISNAGTFKMELLTFMK